MEDRHKYRVWDKERKIMWEMWPTEEGYFFTDGSPNALETHESYYEFGEILMMEDRFVLLQCTGLKDKNGTLIFEGDILKLVLRKDFIGFNENVEVVELYWHDSKFESGWWLKNENIPDIGGPVDFSLDWLTSYEVEVIGNKYEHSHLLTKDV